MPSVHRELPPPETTEADIARATALSRALGERSAQAGVLAEGLGAELAVLASGIEGNAQLLCEAIGNPEVAVKHGESLWQAVRRLRALSDKINFFVGSVSLRLEPTDIGDLLLGVREELIQYAQGSFQVLLDVARSLPLAMASPHGLREAIRYLVEVIFSAEPTAGTLTLRAQTVLQDADEPRILLEIQAESVEMLEVGEVSAAQLRLAYAAARNLLDAQGASMSIVHWPGLDATASIMLDSTTMVAADPLPAVAEGPHEVHPFGGVLILATDPSIREMIAEEVEKSGRQIFVCSDGAACRALFTATPERFELLILEAEGRREPGETLAALAREMVPGIKVILLGRSDRLSPGDDDGADLRFIRKPFGILELREALAGLVGTSPGVAGRG